MASGKSLELRDIPKRTREWVIQHIVKDVRIQGVDVPQPANRAERRAAERGRAWYGNTRGERARAAKTTLRRGASAGVSNG